MTHFRVPRNSLGESFDSKSDQLLYFPISDRPTTILNLSPAILSPQFISQSRTTIPEAPRRQRLIISALISITNKPFNPSPSSDIRFVLVFLPISNIRFSHITILAPPNPASALTVGKAGGLTFVKEDILQFKRRVIDLELSSRPSRVSDQ